MGRLNTGASDERPPLARLFAVAYRQLVDGLHERLRERGWGDVRPAFGFALLAARDRPTTATELAALMGTSKQAAWKLVESMAAAGYVWRGAPGEDARLRPIRPTDRGLELLGAVEAIYRELEDAWAAALGDPGLERLRRDLIHVVADDQGRLPPVRPTW
jgi:DNA-binding MarR family transcriptional regulator